MARIQCPQCQWRQDVGAEVLGTPVGCPQCGEIFTPPKPVARTGLPIAKPVLPVAAPSPAPEPPPEPPPPPSPAPAAPSPPAVAAAKRSTGGKRIALKTGKRPTTTRAAVTSTPAPAAKPAKATTTSAKALPAPVAAAVPTGPPPSFTGLLFGRLGLLLWVPLGVTGLLAACAWDAARGVGPDGAGKHGGLKVLFFMIARVLGMGGVAFVGGVLVLIGGTLFCAEASRRLRQARRR